MPTALTSTPFKIGSFTAVSSAFGAGLVAIALTYTPPAPPFGGAPVFEVELFDAGMVAPRQTKGASNAVPATVKVEPKPAPTAEPPSPRETLFTTPTSEPTPRVESSASVNSSIAATSQSGIALSSRASVSPSTSRSPVAGDDRQGAPTQGAQGGAQTDAYEAQVIRWLDARKKHPGRLQGVVTLKFIVDRRGRLRSSQVSGSSGDPRLDRIAQQQLRDAAPLPRPPRDVTWQTREITVSLDYRLHS